MSDWSSDVCSSDLLALQITRRRVDSEASGDRGATEQHAETQAVARRQRDFRVPELVAERETGTDEGPELAMATGVGDPTRVDQFGLAPLLIRRGPYRPQHETHATVGQRPDRPLLPRRTAPPGIHLGLDSGPSRARPGTPFTDPERSRE